MCAKAWRMRGNRSGRLRTQDAGETTLPVRLRRMAEAAEGDGLAAQFSTFGAYRPLPAEQRAGIAARGPGSHS